MEPDPGRMPACRARRILEPVPGKRSGNHAGFHVGVRGLCADAGGCLLRPDKYLPFPAEGAVQPVGGRSGQLWRCRNPEQPAFL